MTQREKEHRDLIEGTLIEAAMIEESPLGAAELQRRSGVPRSTFHRRIARLVEEGRVDKDETSGAYSAPPEILAGIRRLAAQRTAAGVEAEHDGSPLQ